MKTNIFSLVILLALMTTVVSCKDDDKDNEKPTINVIEPTNDEEITAGSEMHLKVEFTDNVKLKEYKVDIHVNDGHDHKKSEEHGWTYQKTWSLEGKKTATIDNHEIVVPITVENEPIKTGEYHLGIFVTDEAGNEAYQFIDIIIKSQAK